MGIVKDIWKIVCHMANADSFICPGVNPYGACNVYYNAGVEAMNRIGTCPYKEVRRPEAPKKATKVRIGQQKQAPKRIKVETT